MKIVYVAHPIRGNVAANIARVEMIVEFVMKLRGEVYPIAPYLDACRYLDDEQSEDRARAFDANYLHFALRLVNELWICGTVSKGVLQEIDWANSFGIPVIHDPLPVALKERLASIGN